MQIVYLESTLEGLNWLLHYYSKVFPEGAAKAYEHRKKAEAILMLQPDIGVRIEGAPRARKYVIPQPPFSFVYRVKPDRIEIVYVHDERSDPRKSNL